MTDNEIIKALECCARLNRKCNECPLLNDGAVSEHCISVIRNEALDIIKRQQAEIEGLKEINTGLALNLLYSVVNKDPELRKEIMAVAITEFAERLKAEILEWQYEFEYYEERKKAAKQVDNLVKEMMEDDNGA